MLKSLRFLLYCSRAYSLPMSFFSWIVVFCYGIKHSGNMLFGLLALLGILVSHLATNLFDDFVDYKLLTKKNIDNSIVLPNTQKGKCAYLLDKSVTTRDVLKIVLIYLLIAGCIGLFFVLKVGYLTILFMFIGLIMVLLYPILSNLRLSEFAVGICFGPLIFCGTFFVMTSYLSLKVLLLSIPSMLFTINLIYTDTFMDYDIDKNEGKKTFIALFDKKNAVRFQIFFLFVAYLLAYKITPLSCLSLPFAIDLIKSEYLFVNNSNKLPQKKWYHFPFEQWEDIKSNRSTIFMFRMYQARNLMIYTSILLTIGILL